MLMVEIDLIGDDDPPEESNSRQREHWAHAWLLVWGRILGSRHIIFKSIAYMPNHCPCVITIAIVLMYDHWSLSDCK